MPLLHYRHPGIDDSYAPRVPDPNDINDNFEDIARLINGGLGIENLKGGRVASLAMFAHGYAPIVLNFRIDTTAGTFPAAAQLFYFPASLDNDLFLKRATFAGYASNTFAGTLYYRDDQLNTITDCAGRPCYSKEGFAYPDWKAGTKIYFNKTAGTFTGIMSLIFLAKHEAP